MLPTVLVFCLFFSQSDLHRTLAERDRAVAALEADVTRSQAELVRRTANVMPWSVSCGVLPASRPVMSVCTGSVAWVVGEPLRVQDHQRAIVAERDKQLVSLGAAGASTPTRQLLLAASFVPALVCTSRL